MLDPPKFTQNGIFGLKKKATGNPVCVAERSYFKGKKPDPSVAIDIMIYRDGKEVKLFCQKQRKEGTKNIEILKEECWKKG
jgi:hypothetical protein